MPATAKIIISAVNPEETRMGIAENGRLMEYIVERKSNSQLVGSIFSGRVCNVVRGIQAAFIDIGLDKNAFLYLGDKADITEGQKVLVEITKDARGTKGPTATLDLSLPGRYAVLLPGAAYIGISRKITESAERARLKKIAEEVTGSSVGVVIRTNAQGVAEEALRRDLRQLLADWQVIQARAKLAKNPQVLHRELDISVRIVRDYLNADVDEVIVDDVAVYKRLKELLQGLADERCRLTLHDKQTDIFTYYRLSDDIASISDRRIDLPSGGYLIIDYTEAMTVIDVNSGHFSGRESLAETVMQINREAAAEIARQLRLRDIGGIIVVDFIDMDKKEYREEIMALLEEALQTDKMKPCVQDMTVLNLVEITRKKARQNLSAVLYAPCPVCQGSGRVQSQETIGLEIKRRLRTLLAKPCAPRSILIMVSPWLAEWLNHKVMRQWEKELNCTLAVTAEPRLQLETFSLLDNTGVDK